MHWNEREAETITAVESAYAEYGKDLGRFVIRLCGSREDAEDILLETFVEAHRQWGAFAGSGSRRSWLYGIAVNRVRMSRRKGRRQFEALDEEMPRSDSDPTAAIALRQEIAKLPLKQREAFLLVKSEELTAREAAQILKRPMGTVLYEVHRATKALKNALADDENQVQSFPQCRVEL